MKTDLITLLVLAALSPLAQAEPQTFDFKDPKGVNNAVFKLDAPLEAINGNANGVSGTVTFDSADPGATRGRLVEAASTLHVPNPLMKEHMHGEQWLNVKQHPTITFDLKQLGNVKTAGGVTTADASGTLAIKGVSRELTVPVKMTYLKDRLSQRVPNMKGDLLVIRSQFEIKRGDFDINPKAPADKVSDTIELSLSIAGSAPR